MEISLYIFDAFIAVLLLYWMAKMGKRKPGTALTGVFAYQESAEQAPGKIAAAGKPADPGKRRAGWIAKP